MSRFSTENALCPPFARAALCLALTFAISEMAFAQSQDTVISADDIRTSSDTVVLTGRASVSQNTTEVKADTIVYKQSTDVVTARGRASLRKGDLHFFSPEMRYALADESGEMQDVEFTYSPNGIRGHADSIEFKNGVSTNFEGSRITTCPAGDESWWIAADSVEIDDATEYAFIKGASFYAGGVPVAVLPWAALPATTKRTSGILLPSFGYSSSKGAEVTVPIYWNIAPNYDYTFTPHVMSRRGVILGNEFRLLTDAFASSFTYDWLQHDSERKKSRYEAGIKLRGHTSGFNYWVDYHRVSDGQYFRDFSSNAYDGATDILDQIAGVSYGWQHFSTSLVVHKGQALERENGTQYAKPYSKAPQWTGRMFFSDLAGFELSGLAEVTRFTHPDKDVKAQGNRFYATQALSYPMRGSWWFATPKVRVTALSYRLKDFNSLNASVASRYDRHSSLFAPTYSFDTGLIFDRAFELKGKALTQTLEPRLFYAYTPYRNQSRMPTFDSAIADLSFGGLFEENLFTGRDRISHTNSLTAALTSRILDATGYEWARAAIGERYYFKPQDVSLSLQNGRGTTTKRMPDYLAAFDLNFTKTVHFTSAAQYSRELTRVTRANVGIRWQPKTSSVVGLYYRHNYAPETPDDHIRQVDFAAQWPISGNLYGLARYNYSLYGKRMVEALAGVEYLRNCWSLRFVAQRYLKGDNKYTNNFFLQLELRGLGSVGSSPMEVLRRNIPGYEKAAFAR